MMTYKKFYETVAAEMSDNAEVMEFIKDKMAKLNKRSDESSTRRAAIKAVLTTEPQAAQTIADLTGLSRQSVSSNLTMMIKSGEPIIKENGLNADGKACKTYRLEQQSKLTESEKIPSFLFIMNCQTIQKIRRQLVHTYSFNILKILKILKIFPAAKSEFSELSNNS